MVGRALQDRFLTDSACFGCGRDHPDGLRLKSYPDGDGLVARWTPSARFQGPPGVVNGGVMAVPMDCHGTWTAMYTFTDASADELSGAVTAGYCVTLTAPTPIDREVTFRSRVTELQGRKAKIAVTATVGDDTVAEFTGTFIRVEPFVYAPH